MSNNIPYMSDYKYPLSDLSKLKKILDRWNLAYVYLTCIGKKIVCIQIII